MKKDKSLIKPTDNDLRKQIRYTEFLAKIYFIFMIVAAIDYVIRENPMVGVVVIISTIGTFFLITTARQAKIRLEIREAIQCKSKKN